MANRERIRKGLALAAAWAVTSCANVLGVRDLEVLDGSAALDADASRDASATPVDATTSDAGLPPDGSGSDDATSDRSISDGAGSTDAGSDEGHVDSGGDTSPDGTTCAADTRTDPGHCGRCGHSCLGSACSDGRCVPTHFFVDNARRNAFGIVGDDLYLSVANSIGDVDNRLYVMSKTVVSFDTSNPSFVPLASQSGRATGFVADDASVYMGTSTNDATHGAIVAYDKVTHAGAILVPGPEHVVALAVDATHVTWQEQLQSGFRMRRVPKSGATAPESLVDMDYAVYQIASHGGRVYWSDLVGLHRCDPAACVKEDLTTVTDSPFAFDGTDVFFGAFAPSAPVRRCETSDCARTTRTFVASQVYPMSLTRDATRLYWTEFANPNFTSYPGTLRSCPLAGCTTPTDHVVDVSVQEIVVDDTWIFYATPAGLFRVAK